MFSIELEWFTLWKSMQIATKLMKCLCVSTVCLGNRLVQFQVVKHTTKGILNYVHTNVWGPTRDSSLGGSHYFVTFIDDFSCKVWVYFMKQKYEVFEKVKLWKDEVEKQMDRKIRYLRSDNDMKYTDSWF